MNNFMFDMSKGFDFLTNGGQQIILTVIFVALPVLLYFYTKRFFAVVLGAALSVAGIVFAWLDWHYLYTLIILIYAVFLVINLFVNLSVFRPLLIKKFRDKTKHHKIRKLKKNKEVSVIFDKVTFYSQLTTAVKYFSRTKTGALITFQRTDDLKPLMKNGVMINCPFNVELLETIFYNGTRLHDGAVIIKDNKIVAASVYYELTTRPLSGNYGTRHRAAIGISENSDSITVVVSEETGRISIAKEGNIETVSPDNFERIFSEYMEESEE